MTVRIEDRPIVCECNDWLERQVAGLPGRCDKHRDMMQTIRRVYDGIPALRGLIYAESDGFGEGMHGEDVGWDWSGIRDSTPEGVERMYGVIERARALVAPAEEGNQ